MIIRRQWCFRHARARRKLHLGLTRWSWYVRDWTRREGAGERLEKKHSHERASPNPAKEGGPQPFNRIACRSTRTSCTFGNKRSPQAPPSRNKTQT